MHNMVIKDKREGSYDLDDYEILEYINPLPPQKYLEGLQPSFNVTLQSIIDQCMISFKII
jgi:hypothetical protein